MSAPNRANDVKAIVADHASRFPAADDSVKERVLAVIALRLNRQYGDHWMLLRRKDRGNRIGSDNLVWNPPGTTKHEHFDVLSDNGAMWKDSGIVEQMPWYDPGDAEYVDAATLPRFADPVLDGTGPIEPPPPPPPPPPPSDAVAQLRAEMLARLAGQDQLIATMRDSQNLVERKTIELTGTVELHSEQIDALEDRPTPDLNNLVAAGTTGRNFGHAHIVELAVMTRKRLTQLRREMDGD